LAKRENYPHSQFSIGMNVFVISIIPFCIYLNCSICTRLHRLIHQYVAVNIVFYRLFIVFLRSICVFVVVAVVQYLNCDGDA